MNTLKKALCLTLAALLLLSAAACAAKTAAPAAPTETTGTAQTTETAPETTAEPAVEDADVRTYLNGSYVMNIPAETAEKLIVETEGLEPGMLFSVSEIKSVEAAEKNGYGRDSGLGWLCGVKKVTTDELHELLCWDMSGMDVFAQDEQGNFFLVCRPTDVRLEREGQITEADAAEWTALNAWVTDVMMTDFINSNGGLYRAWRGNSELDIYFNQMLWKDLPFTITTLENGTMDPALLDKAPYLEDLLNGLYVEWQDGECPDGEYLVLTLPEDDVRIDFFSADYDLVRIVTAGEYETLYRVTYGGGASIGERMRAWYGDLVAASK